VQKKARHLQDSGVFLGPVTRRPEPI
jgi:hypothetical protein